MEFPITYFEQNLILNTRREAWAGYRLEPWHYEHLGREQRLTLLYRLARLFWHLEGYEGHFVMAPHAHNLETHFAQVAAGPPGPLAEVRRRYCRGAREYLERLYGPEGHEYGYYLFLKLPRPPVVPRGLGAWLRSIWLEPRRLLDEALGIAPYEMLDYELAAYQEHEGRLLHRLNQVVRARRLSGQETGRLIKQGFYRGLGGPPGHVGPGPRLWAEPREGGGKVLRPGRAEIRTLAQGELDLRHPRRIGVSQIIGGQEATGYQAFAVLGELPDEFPFPGAEWLYTLQDLPFPLEVHLRWESLSYREALGQVRRKKLEIADQDRHTRGAGEEMPLALLDAHDQALGLEHDLKQRKFPTLLASASFAVAAAEPSLLWERLSHLRSHLAALQCSVEVPAGEQLPLFAEAIPGAPRRVRHYIHRLPPEALAAGMFLCTKSLGDGSGPYLGRTGALGQPVYLDPARGPAINRSASAAFLGSLGSGKSFTANLLTYLAVVAGGARGLILDPKGERGGWLQLLPELEGHLNLITLSPSPRDRGKLDPFVIFRSLGQEGRHAAANLAISLLSLLCRVGPGDPAFAAILAAVAAVRERPHPSLGQVVEQLARAAGDGPPEVRLLGPYLQGLRNLAYAELLFGEGHEAAVDTGYPLNILQLQHLTLPPPGRPRGEYTLEETLSVALLHAITAFAGWFARRDREVFKVVLLDEAWALLESSQGRLLVSQLLRTGRAMNTAIYLVTQSTADLLDERVRNQLGMKFVFRSDDAGEVARALELLNLDQSEENGNTVRSLGTGEVLMQDLAGRVGVVRIDPVYEHLLAAFDTRPTALAAREDG